MCAFDKVISLLVIISAEKSLEKREMTTEDNDRE